MRKIKKETIILFLVTTFISLCLLYLGVEIGSKMDSFDDDLVINGITYEHYQSQMDSTGEFVVSLFMRK